MLASLAKRLIVKPTFEAAVVYEGDILAVVVRQNVNIRLCWNIFNEFFTIPEYQNDHKNGLGWIVAVGRINELACLLAFTLFLLRNIDQIYPNAVHTNCYTITFG